MTRPPGKWSEQTFCISQWPKGAIRWGIVPPMNTNSCSSRIRIYQEKVCFYDPLNLATGLGSEFYTALLECNAVGLVRTLAGWNHASNWFVWDAPSLLQKKSAWISHLQTERFLWLRPRFFWWVCLFFEFSRFYALRVDHSRWHGKRAPNYINHHQ